MNQQEFLDKLDTFSNALTTHNNRMNKLAVDIVKNGQAHAKAIGVVESNIDIVNTWNVFAGDVESVMETTADIMEDFQTYSDLWEQFFLMEDDK